FIQILAFLPEALRRVFWVLGFLAAIPPLVVGIGAIVERFSSCSLGANDNKSSVAALLGVLEAVFPSDSSESLVARLAQQREAAELASRPVRHGEEVLRTLGVLPESCEIEYVEEPEPVEEEPEVEEEPAQATADLGTAEETEADEPAAPAAKPSFRVVGDGLPDPGATQMYRPQVADVARRAALFDLPDPSEEANDPFATTAAPSSMADRLGYADRQNARRISDHLGTFDDVSDEPDGLDVPVPSYDEPAPVEDKPKRFSLFDRKKREEDYAIDDDSTWDDLESQDSGSTRGRRNDSRWKGGAAISEELRESDADAPSDDELVEAAETLAIDELLCHDIWFVALGANGLDHAGMKAFIAKHRPQLRGAFVINLDCVGAGTLSVLSSEGLGNTRRVDRRINRLLKGAAADLHVDLSETPFDWRSTDATPAMRGSMRAATIMGVNEFGLPALSRTPDDVPENVDLGQASLVASLVTELIRRA
ncbi:MAG: M28 family peptidase, partial [Coriobacteriaceae bacterium]|nr:M28 family peptidase [Coriobacteriaceae bacterium]